MSGRRLSAFQSIGNATKKLVANLQVRAVIGKRHLAPTRMRAPN